MQSKDLSSYIKLEKLTLVVKNIAVSTGIFMGGYAFINSILWLNRNNFLSDPLKDLRWDNLFEQNSAVDKVMYKYFPLGSKTFRKQIKQTQGEIVHKLLNDPKVIKEINKNLPADKKIKVKTTSIFDWCNPFKTVENKNDPFKFYEVDAK